MTQSNDAHQVRWVVAGPISPSPAGERASLNRGNFPEWLESHKPSCTVTIADDLGSGETRTFEISVEKVRDLTLRGLTSSIPELTKLLEIAGDVRDAEACISAVRDVVGHGELVDKLSEIAAIKPPPAQEGEPAPEGGDVFEQAEVPKAQSSSVASTAVDAFLRASRPKAKAARRSKSARKLRDAIEEAVFATARSILSSPEAAALEIPLRGLSFLMSHCPQKSGFKVDLIDVPMDQLIGELQDWQRGDLVDEPDAIFIPFPIPTVDALSALAEVAEGLLCPVIADVPPGLLGTGDVESLVEKLSEIEPKDSEPAWLALRQEESSRWLCGVTNGVLLQAEGTGVAQRTVVGSGVWALAATMSKSYADTGSFARILGQPGAISAPAVRTLTEGRYEGMAAPTEAFIPIRGQVTLAKHGLTALGSARNSDSVVFATTPMMRAAADAVPLPAQLLTGRIVRFAQWVRDQIPAQADTGTVASIFHEASKVFLFPGMQEVGEVKGSLHEQEGAKELRIEAKVHPSHAGIPFEINFGLPFGE